MSCDWLVYQVYFWVWEVGEAIILWLAEKGLVEIHVLYDIITGNQNGQNTVTMVQEIVIHQ